MAMLCRLCAFVLAITLCSFSFNTGVIGLGVNYGLNGDNLPPPNQVVTLLKSRNIMKIRIFDPNIEVLKALHNSGIETIVGVRNEDLKQISDDVMFAKQWITDNIVPHVSLVKITSIGVGNEVIQEEGGLATYVLGAMQNINSALNDFFALHIPVTTAISMNTIGTSYPPSAGAFSEFAAPFMGEIASFLATKGYPLLVNVYPFFAYVNNPSKIPLDYALLKETAPPVQDGQLVYHNLFDAMVDVVYSAMEKVGIKNVEIMVSETGWSSGGNADATVANAQTYVDNLVAHIGGGTPKRPGKTVETYLFELFDEDLKTVGIEQNFGLYYPNMTEVYHVKF